MQPAASGPVRWTTSDLECLPQSSNRYEIIAGELFVARAPHWKHQQVSGRIFARLDSWASESGCGQAAIVPGILFGDTDNVVPDVVWASGERLNALLDAAGHLNGAPELVVEVLSPGEQNERRDREFKLKLYSTQGVQEYWIVDWQLQQLEIYRREQAVLRLVATLLSGDTLESPLLPGFSCPIGPLFT
ncbi:Uma2 family endonuclease [Gloeobacter kilaueensis]|uniref:Putative restriction endonuclease domain-containing protein n=1 Tax=Gloeobacter kilaueensis (strain ATCC BAA-2537 / CCAP 1431/1 / ULC 316 / JS1) TaxID=1183438 RepID=U5QR07_GLOK1|nr:Uma2 family endonuclease [Gloeobacter kilaueensis]AGY60150.1 hypothetical protein GKIL_3904 [Gloeobacter kilaueensis JS1]